MKVLFVCAMGMSTSILMKKMQAYWQEQGVENEIAAVGIDEVEVAAADADAVLVGPQLAYRKDEVASLTGKPVAAIPPSDYGLGNCANIDALAHEIAGL